MRFLRWVFLSLAVPSAMWAEPEIIALQLECDDVARCAQFYQGAFGFERVPGGPGGPGGDDVMKNGDVRLVLQRSESRSPAGTAAHVNLNVSVEDLSVIRQRATANGGRVTSEPLDSAVGPYLTIEDPSGNSIHAIDHPWDDARPGALPTVFNLGLSVPDLAASEAFFVELGFRVATREYLPETLVFERAGMTYVVIHGNAQRTAEPAEATGMLVVSGVPGEEVRGPSGIVVRSAVAP